MGAKIWNRFRCGVLAGALALLGGSAQAAAPPPTAEVLDQLHQSNQKEIDAGRLAVKKGQSQQIKDYGEMLVRDHSAADQQVAALARQEQVNMAVSTPEPAARGDMQGDMKEMDAMPADEHFDVKFARQMLDDHKRNIAAVQRARDDTKDDRLKKLLDDFLPMLKKHRDVAQKLVDAQPTM